MRCFLFWLLIFPPCLVHGQDNAYFVYDKDLLPKEFHQGRREALRAKLPRNSVAVFFAAPVRNRSNDVQYEYHQDPNFYYLTGLREPHALLLIFKEEQHFDSELTNEVIFVQPKDATHEMWDGRRLGPGGVKDLLGIRTSIENKDFADFAIDFARFDKVFYIQGHGDIRDDKRDRGDLFSLWRHFEQKTEGQGEKLDNLQLNEMMASLREIKLPEELTLMMNAVDFTCEALKETMKALQPGMAEYQAKAIIEYMFKKNGAEQPGFPSITGGGENSCVLHYTQSRKILSGGDLLVCDVGAEYHGYSADVTRTIPVDGSFSEAEAAIYGLVLEAQKAGIAAARPGNKFWDPNVAARAVVQEGLKKLGIIETVSESHRYFMHGTSHYLGLDVHDVGLYGPLKPGQVITVEPGIYIPAGSSCDKKWWNIGVRIEDDVLITEGGAEVLSDCVPKEMAEIEELMKQESLFNEIQK